MNFLPLKLATLLSVVDSASILMFWLCSFINHNHENQLQHSITSFSFNDSLFDIVMLGLVRGLILAVAFHNSEWYLSVVWLKASAFGVSLFSLIYLFFKALFFILNSSPLYNTQAWAAVILTLSIIFVLIELTVSIYLPFKYALISGDTERYNPLRTSDVEAQSQGTLRRVMLLAIPQWPLLTIGLVALFISSGAFLAIPALFGKVIEAVTPSSASANPREELKEAVLLLLLVFVVGSIGTFVRAWCFTWAGQRLVCKLRQDVFSAVVTQDISFFDTTRTGELTSRLSSDTSVIQNAATVNISMLVRYVIQISGSVILLFLYSWQLTLIMLSVVPIVVIGAVTYGKYVKKLSKQFQDQLSIASTTAEEVFSNIRTVRSFSREETANEQYWKDIYKSYEIGFKVSLAQGSFAGVLSMIAQCAMGLVLFVGGLRVINGQMTPGDLTSFLLYTITLAMSFAVLSSLFGDFMTAAGASTRIFQLIDQKPKIPQTGGLMPEGISGEISLDNVSFHYPSRPEVAVLQSVSLTLRPGTITALVGPSGGGKTSIVSLLERFYDPTSGRILLDGVDITGLDPKWYRQQLGLVSQEPVLFGCSIKENLVYGVHREITEEEIKEVAIQANAFEFIDKLPEKFETTVGERGVRLSGGQKQRIAIARALLMNPSVLLLDEATSALDAESEHLVQEAIDRAMVRRTVLVVAHRLSTVRNAHCVIVVQNGTIVEKGTHDELMASPTGVYRKLVKRQLQASEK